MCGIAGFVGPEDPASLQRLADALIHRGPDGEGLFRCPHNGVSLAHRRLAILDIEGGRQPMWNEDESIGVVFNGEIYNHLDLRAALTEAGHVFRSHHSDTEVLIHGYEEWGESLPERLNGMFAFCLYDRPRKRLFFARDRFGKKPLYYAQTAEGMVFASELKPLLGYSGLTAEIDPLSVRKYFAYGFIPAPHTLYRNVRKLPGGCRMAFDIAQGTLQVRPYYAFAAQPDESLLHADEGEVAEDLRERLVRATARRLIADRPVGIFLSGGLDSSTILACAAKCASSAPIRTFSIGFRERSYDESDYAQCVADAFGAEHNVEILDLAAARSIAPRVIDRLDEPMGDSSILPTYLLAEFARKQVVVALGGDGADELLAGYAPFRALTPADLYVRLLPAAVRRMVRRGVDSLPASDRYFSLDFKLKRTLRGLDYPRSVWNPAWLGPLEPKAIAELLGEPAPWEEVYADALAAWEGSRAPDPAGRTTEFYARFYLQDSILTKVDRSTMMVGLEARAPFLDNDVVELAARLPTALKCRQGRGKHILRRAMRGILPDAILDRPKKGFGIPLTAWLKTWDFPAPSDRLPHRGDVFRSLLESHRSGRSDERLFLWCWMVLQRHLAEAVRT